MNTDRCKENKSEKLLNLYFNYDLIYYFGLLLFYDTNRLNKH